MEIKAKPHNPQNNPPSLLSPRSDSHPYSTTFVHANTSSFKQVVQFLTGSPKSQLSDSLPPPPPPPPPPSSSSKTFTIPPVRMPPKKQGFKLYERRNHLKNTSLFINTFSPNFPPNSAFSPRKPEILSPSLLDFPSLSLSPVTPLNNDDSCATFEKSPSPSLSHLYSTTAATTTTSSSMTSSEVEERAIAEKGFYFHPSPLTTPRDSEPRLLPLFPVTSPRVVSESESTS